jgi:hypothetical protein
VTSRALARCVLVWAIVTTAACIVVRRAFALDIDESRPRAVIGSVWSDGQLVARAVLVHTDDADAQIDAAIAAHPGATLVYESVVGQAPVVAWSEPAFAMSFVPGRDGIAAHVGDRVAYMTPDELLSKQAYDKDINFGSIGLGVGVDIPIALALLAERLGMTVGDLRERATFDRIRVVRSVRGAPPAPPAITAETMTKDDVRAAVIAGGSYLARGVDAQGRFRYLVDAPTNRTLSGYDWPRHSGATYFLAQVAALSGDPAIAYATLRAASYVRDLAIVSCGAYECVASGGLADVGSSALATIAFVEVARSHLDASYALLVPKLTAFIRSQQRPDGEFMHEYDRGANRPVDVQLLYYSGEAALALSRAHALLHDARDLDAATRAVAHLTGPAWSFFGSRYYWGEEHWTCQAMDDLMLDALLANAAPNRKALDFCLGWQAFGRKLQYAAGDSPFDGDGAYGFGPIVTPRFTPAGSRTEAAIATLEAARLAGVEPGDLAALERQIRRSLALLMRQQFRPGPKHLFADPAAVEGAIPGTAVDWQLRIDYLQHAGCAMVRWLELKQSSR